LARRYPLVVGAILGALAVGFAAAPRAESPQTAPLRIGHVNVQDVAARSTSVRAIVRPIEESIKLKGDDMERALGEYQRARREFDGRRSVLTTEQIEVERERLDKMLDELNAKQADMQARWSKLENEVMAGQIDRIMDAVKQVGRARGYDFLLPSELVLHAADSHDATALVVQWLDRPAASHRSNRR
jgi:Skp family chaperone for outer membrane proteins